MLLESPNKSNVLSSNADGGSVVNVSDAMVVLREPTAANIRKSLGKMTKKLRRCLTDLLCMPFSEVVDRYGPLNFRTTEYEGRENLPYGAIVQSGVKLAHLKDNAVTRGLISIGELSLVRADGRARRKMPRHTGKAAVVLSKLTPKKQADLIRALIQNESIDQFYRFHQTSLAGIEALESRVATLQNKDVTDFLQSLANHVGEMVSEKTARGDGKSAAKGTGYEFAPMWLSMQLAVDGYWLFPTNIFHAVRAVFMPHRLMPLVAHMCLGDHSKDIADLVCNLAKDRRFHISATFNTFVTAALSSDMWSSRRFCSYPLEVMKLRTATERVSVSHRSSALNALYRLMATVFEVRISDRPEGPMFTEMLRLNAQATGFNWTRNPSPKSTKAISRMIGRAVETVPTAVIEWGDVLEGLLPSFGVKYPKELNPQFNTWLAFLLTLDPEDFPANFSEVTRSHAERYAAFLNKNYSSKVRRLDLLAIGKMASAWKTVSNSENFPATMRNPFDVEIDTHPQTNTNASGREAIPPAVAAFLNYMNYKDDYGFARQDKRYWKRRLNRTTMSFDDVFLGLEARAFDICLFYGFRLIDGRWMDSGEGDELIVDLDTLDMVENPLPCRKKGTRNGMIRRFWIDASAPGDRPRWELGIYRPHDKSNKERFLSHLDMRLAKMVRDFTNQQHFYDPLDRPVKMVDRKKQHKAASPDKILFGYPLLRDPDDVEFHTAVSEEKCRSYAKDFYKWVQPFLDEHLGYHFPLMIDDEPRFKMHDFRVTAAAEMDDLGSNLKEIAEYLGHMNAGTAAIYVPKKHERIHRAKQRAVDAREASLKTSVEDRLREVVETGYTPDYVKQHSGVASGRRMLEDGKIGKLTEFSHGLCPGGDCEKGGPIVGNKPSAVWRINACSECRFRLTGPRYRMGIKRNINRLSWEVFHSIQRQKILNEASDVYESETGRASSERGMARHEAHTNKKLMEELRAEIKTHRDVLALHEALKEKGIQSDHIIVPASPDYDPDDVAYGFIAGTEYELLFEVMDGETVPHSIIHSSPAAFPRWKELNKEFMKSLKVDNILYGATTKQEDRLIHTFSHAVMETFDTNEITRMLDEPVDFTQYPNLEAFVANLKIKFSETKVITDGR